MVEHISLNVMLIILIEFVLIKNPCIFSIKPSAVDATPCSWELPASSVHKLRARFHFTQPLNEQRLFSFNFTVLTYQHSFIPTCFVL